MKLFAGLGNPGKKYELTRHNAGFICIDKMLEREVDTMEIVARGFSAEIYKGLKSEIYYAKPQTFMNDSGKSLYNIVHFYKFLLPNVCVIHDDLDIRLGEYKIQMGIGPKVHNGISSIEKELNTKEFWRIRIGIDNRNAENRVPGEQYVLDKFTEEELKILDVTISKIIKELGI